MILIEGLPGTGKSTLTKNITTLLEEDGQKPTCFLETDVDSPLRYKDGTALDTNLEDFQSHMVSQWEKFINKQKGLILVESLLIQQQVNFPLLVDRIDIGQKIVERVYKLLEKSNSRIIYLFNSEPVTAFQETMKCRGDGWVKTAVKPLDESPWAKNNCYVYPEAINNFILEITKITEGFLQTSPLPVHKVNVDSKDWGVIQKKVFDIINDN